MGMYATRLRKENKGRSFFLNAFKTTENKTM
jgi:hypothetical protein